MDLNNTISHPAYDIIHNILAGSELETQCLEQIKSYENAQETNSSNSLELLRFSRDISMDAFFHSDDEQLKAKGNMNEILSELSFSSNNNIESNDDTVILLQLSSILDNFFKELSMDDLKIYIYRYFFAYPLDTIASLCNTQVSNVNKTINACNNKLKKLINTQKLNCNGKQLLLSFIDIHNYYLSIIYNSEVKKSLEQTDSTSSEKKPARPLKFWLNIAFAILIIALASINVILITKNNKENPSGKEASSNSSGYIKEAFFRYVGDKKMVNIDALINCQNIYDLDNRDFSEIFIIINNYIGFYYSLNIIDDINLKDFIGQEVINIDEINKFSDSYYVDGIGEIIENDVNETNDMTVYKLLGMDSLEYIIVKTDDTYTFYCLRTIGLDNISLDRISCMQSLENFYGFTSSSKIDSFIISAGDPDTGYADGYAKKVIDDESNLDKLYNILSSSYYIEESIYDYTTSTNFTWTYILDHSVAIDIEGTDGSLFYSLFYYDIGNFFYDEYNDLIYLVNSEEDQEYLEELFKINMHTEPSDPATWNLDIKLDSAGRDYVSLRVTPERDRDYYNLYVGSDYTIEKLENDTWTECSPTLSYRLDPTNNPFDKKLSNSYVMSYADFFVDEKYGTLQKGTYRITITVYDSNSISISNPSHRDYTIEFTVE